MRVSEQGYFIKVETATAYAPKWFETAVVAHPFTDDTTGKLGYNSPMVETPTQLSQFCVIVPNVRADRIQRVAAWLGDIPPDAFEHAMGVLEDAIWDTEYLMATGEAFPKRESAAAQTMLASEKVLSREWDDAL